MRALMGTGEGSVLRLGGEGGGGLQVGGGGGGEVDSGTTLQWTPLPR